jgi:hypothetical protein
MALHHGGLGSFPDQVMWDLWWAKHHWGRFSLGIYNVQVIQFPLPVIILPPALILKMWLNNKLNKKSQVCCSKSIKDLLCEKEKYCGVSAPSKNG